MKSRSEKLCWCCLKMEGNMKSLLNDSLEHDYLNLVGVQTCSWNMLPQWLCWICAREINKARKFQIKATKSYSFLSTYYSQQSGSKNDVDLSKFNSHLYDNILPSLSHSNLELWCTPEETNYNHNGFIKEEIKFEISTFSDSLPSGMDEGLDNVSDSERVYKGKIKSKKQKIKEKKKKNKKEKKIRESKKKIKSSQIVLKNRMVLETQQYKVIRLTPDQVQEEKDKNLKSERYLRAPYKCELCAKGYNYEDVLMNHMTKHENKFNHLECKLCHQFLPSSISLRGHTKSHLVRYQCRECGEIRASRQHLLEHHSLQHQTGCIPPRQYTCNVCGKTMMKRTMFQKHVRLHVPSNRLPCEICGKSFKTIETLRAHKLHHEDLSARRHAEIKRYKCPDCPKEFRYASLLYTHRVTHITTKDFYCVECDLSFKTQANLRLHLNKSQKHIDPDSLKFQCNECGKRYVTMSQLQHHIDCFHMGKREYTCLMCDKRYATKDGLRAHARKEHPPPGVTPPPVVAKHICDVCSRAFKAKAVLVKHLRTHTGERPFECGECRRAFSQKSTLATHIKLVHKKKKAKLFTAIDNSVLTIDLKTSNEDANIVPA